MIDIRPARTLHSHALHHLGRMIAAGEVKPGDSLPSEQLLAKRMSMSRTALREAMKVLSAKGMIESRQRTGAHVRDMVHWNQMDADVLRWRCESTPRGDLFEKMLEMRELIDPAAAAAAARRRTPGQLLGIEAARDAMSAARDPESWAAADGAFHEAVLQATNNELMISLSSVLERPLGDYLKIPASPGARLKYSPLPYDRVYEAIRRRQAEPARQAMQQIVTSSRSNIRRLRKALSATG